MAHTLLPPEGEIVRRHDPDRYFTSLFAAQGGRETLWALYAFNHELARVREATREPIAAMIRLQWWREIVEGARRRHEVAGPIGAALDAGRLDAGDLMQMIDAREAELDPVETASAFEAYLLGSAGSVMVAAARALGDATPERYRRAGGACGAVGVLRNVAALSRQERCVLPLDVLVSAGSSMAEVIGAGVVPHGARNHVLALATRWLDTVQVPRRTVLPALLPVVSAKRFLQGRSGRERGSILLAYAAGRV